MRPGGLTALAVLNFIFCAWNLLMAVSVAAVVAIQYAMPEPTLENFPGADPQQLQQMKMQRAALDDIGFTYLGVSSASMLLTAVLLCLSGIGYLRLKKFLGRYVGTAYGLLAIAAVIGLLAAVPAEKSGGFTLFSVVSLFYPCLTILLLHTTFRRDLIR